MARKKPRPAAPPRPEEILGAVQRSLNFFKPYLKWLIGGAIVLVLAVLGWSGYTYFRHSQEIKAQTSLEQVRPRLSQPDQAEEAIKALEALSRDYPGTRAALAAQVFQAHLLYQTKKYAEAAQAYERVRAASLGPEVQGWGRFVDESLSYCYEAQGDYAKAAQVLKPLADRAHGNYQTALLTRLAFLYDKAGHHQEAARVWQQLLSTAQSPALVSYWKERLAGVAGASPKADK